uniref:GDNF/GAS1 domain-containing protein n=1 Tax=Dicentrarchus labrax TaxID=13489 RepID=A0A8C4ED61_DICLA
MVRQLRPCPWPTILQDLQTPGLGLDDMCNQNPYCSSRYRVMRQCLVGKEKEAMLDNNRECQAALEVLLVSPLYDCRCKRGMKKELQCLQNYWTIHMGLTEAKACNLNGSCKRQRSAYIATCSKEDPNKGETCNKKRCHKALRLFLDRVPLEYSHRLLFCPCQSEGCAERRRQTIVPDCSYKDKEKPNCLERGKLWGAGGSKGQRKSILYCMCMHVCVFVFVCILACFVGTDMTPNYVDSSFSNWTVSPWCTCKGSGNQEEECMNFLHYFTDNTCLSEPLSLLYYSFDTIYPWTPLCPLINLELNVLSFSESHFLSFLIPPLGKICPDFNTKETICM